MGNSEALILIVEDDVNDQTFIQRALKRSGVANRVAVVNDGEEATAYLRGFDLYADLALHPLPRLIVDRSEDAANGRSRAPQMAE